MPKLPPLLGGVISRSLLPGTRRAPAISGWMTKGPWKFDHTVKRSGARSKCAMTPKVSIGIDQLAGVFRNVAAVGDHNGHRLADIAGAIDGNRVIGDWRLHDARHWSDKRGDILAGDDVADARQLQRVRNIDVDDTGVRMLRAENGGETDTSHRREVVNKARTPSEERLILFARHGRADPPARCDSDCRQQNTAHLLSAIPPSRFCCF